MPDAQYIQRRFRSLAAKYIHQHVLCEVLFPLQVSVSPCFSDRSQDESRNGTLTMTATQANNGVVWDKIITLSLYVSVLTGLSLGFPEQISTVSVPSTVPTRQGLALITQDSNQSSLRSMHA